MIRWPNDKKFAFTIVDDTDGGTTANLRPVYDFLYRHGLRTTKTVWVYPSRDKFSGEYITDLAYQKFIKDLSEKGFEIALHNVGSGSFTRKEILKGIESFRDIMGFYPTMQINHASNPDNIYWGAERYTSFLGVMMKALYGDKRAYHGTDPSSKHFWGDVSKKRFKYIRNHTFNGINTLKYDPKMPYKVEAKDKYSNYWFSSSDGHTVKEFNDLITPKNVMRLKRENGLCIVYTHLSSGFTDEKGDLDPRFKENVGFLAKQPGWFVPASDILDLLLEARYPALGFASKSHLRRLDALWVFDRIIKKLRYQR